MVPERGAQMWRLGAPLSARALEERLKQRRALLAGQLGLAEMDQSSSSVRMRTEWFDDTLGPLREDRGAGPMGEHLSDRRELSQRYEGMAELTRPSTEQLRRS